MKIGINNSHGKYNAKEQKLNLRLSMLNLK